jgi:hypothetical protein
VGRRKGKMGIYGGGKIFNVHCTYVLNYHNETPSYVLIQIYNNFFKKVVEDIQSKREEA